MEKSNSVFLMLGEHSYVTYSFPNNPCFTNDEIDFWLVDGNEKHLICKDSILFLIEYCENVFSYSYLNPLCHIDELNEIADSFVESFMKKTPVNAVFDHHLLFDGIGYVTWIAKKKDTSSLILRFDKLREQEHKNIASYHIEEQRFFNWWNNMKNIINSRKNN